MKEYNVEKIHSSFFNAKNRVVQTVRITLQDLEFFRSFEEEIGGNCTGADLLSVVLENIIESNDGEIGLYNADGEEIDSYILDCEDEDDLKAYVVGFSVESVVVKDI